ncbi:MAG: hypothetical protein NY202_03030 [Mollicutes bacterium UO1]
MSKLSVMTGEQDLVKLVHEFLATKKAKAPNQQVVSAEGNGSNFADLSLPTIKDNEEKIKQLEQEVQFYANLAENYLTRLQNLAAQVDSQDLAIQELTAERKELSGRFQKRIKEQAEQLEQLNNSLLAGKRANEWCQAIHGSPGRVSWQTKRANFVRLLTTNLPVDRISEEVGDIYQNWQADVSLEILTEEDKEKLAQLAKWQGKLEKIKRLKRPKITC